MTTGTLALTLGIVLLQWQAALPEPLLLAAIGAVGILLFCLRSWRWAAAVGACLVGFAWAGMLAHGRLADALPEDSEGRDTEVVAVVSALPQRFENGWRFDMDVERSELRLPRHVSVAWYRSVLLDPDDLSDPAAVHVGERWRLTLRCKRPHGNANPHGFDYEGWLFEQGVRATCYVRPRAGSQRLERFVSSPATLVQALRENVRSRFQAVLGDRPYAGILVALAVGDQRAIDQGLWLQFARTGLTHLLSVSGLHITLVAGLAYALVNALWRRSARLPLYFPAQQAAAVAGICAALFYSLLAGFAVPAQRTLYMLAVVGLSLIARRTIAVRKVLSAALCAVLAVDPWAVLSAGFWLSFGAVSLLFYAGSGRIAKDHWLAAWGRAQWAMSVGMLPLMLALFQQFSLVSPLANAVAIPSVSFVITPLVLLAAIPGFEFLLWPADALTSALMAGVAWLAAMPLAVWQQQAPPAWAFTLGLLGTLWLLAPRGFPARWVGGALFLPLVLLPPDRPAAGAARLTVLDVGQGLAVHVQTSHHDLLFDTGPAFSPDANSGNRIIVPYLRAIGVRRLDAMVVSHADKDHSGGAESVLDAIPVDLLTSSLDDASPLLSRPLPKRRCADGQAWDWDGVRFLVLHPSPESYASPARKTNDMSCVLRIETASGSALVPSDIEALSEEALLRKRGPALRADVLVVPHHGSRTSSTAGFVTAVGARQAVFAVGYRNRFGHPKGDIVAGYRRSGAALFRSDRDGAVSFEFADGSIRVAAQRENQPRYWYGR